MDAAAVAAKLFVAFEGIDGSGKTTPSNRVARRLRETGHAVTHGRENGVLASTVTRAIRELGRHQRNLALTPRVEMMMNFGRDLQLQEGSILPALRASDVGVADRFIHTAAVLAHHGRGLPGAAVRQVLRAVPQCVRPDPSGFGLWRAVTGTAGAVPP